MVQGDETTENETNKFDWLKLKQEIDSQHADEEEFKDKFLRKIKENPVVPVGCLVTLGALSYGLWSFRTGRKKMSQYMMRLRIGAQGFTIVALIVGIGITAAKNK